MTTAPIAKTLGPITVTPGETGTPLIRWDMSVETADQLLGALRSAERSAPAFATQAFDSLYLAMSEAVDFANPQPIKGCAGLWPDASAMPLTEPALIASTDSELLAILLPGTPAPLDAINTALEAVREHGLPIDTSDESLMADVHPARWMVLNQCESADHDFHPELAMLGSATPGAVLVTRVDLTHN